GRRDLHCVWPSADVLLSATHSGDSSRGGYCIARARGESQSVALRQSSDDESAAARWIYVEPGAPLYRLGRRRCGALSAVPVVCATKGDESGGVDALYLMGCERRRSESN